jgi:subtilisin family serine protease
MLNHFSCRYILIILTLIIGWSLEVSAQKEGSIIAGKFVFKVADGEAINIENLKEYWAAYGVTDIKEKFPFVGKISADELKKEGAVNLNLIYEATVQAPIDVNFILGKVKFTQGLEYAEPLFWHDLQISLNDPHSNIASGSQRQFLNRVGAYDAWNYSTGDSTLTIAIIDAGTRWNHEDLIQNLRTNSRDPLNGVDDDRNGLIDDFRGWDFSDDDNDPAPTTNGHGNSVASFSSARGNNGIGVAGIAFTTKILPIKVYGNSFAGYDGIAYAAAQGANVLNLSWGRGGGSPSAFEQDVINFAAINRNAVVVAAAGNTAGMLNFFPASYENVISVVHTQITDEVEPFSSSSYNIDFAAPGSELFGITTTGTYGNAGTGSSLAAPIVSGAAALLKSVYPSYSPQQIAELLRINTDDISSVGLNGQRVGVMGSGRLNILKAVRGDRQISLRAIQRNLTTLTNSSQLLPGDTVNLSCTFQNYLSAIPAFTAQLSVLSPGATVVQPFFSGPTLPANQSVTNRNSPFRLALSSSLQNNAEIICRLTFNAAGYSDVQYFNFKVSTDLLNIRTPRIGVTATANGRIGFNDNNNQEGIGFQLLGKNILGEGGLLIATGPNTISNCIYDTSGKDNNFLKTSPIRFVTSNNNLQQANCTFTDDRAPQRVRVGVSVNQNTLAYQSSPADRVVIYTYDITNTSGRNFDSLCVGIYTDFQVGDYRNNRTDWDTSNKIGYTYSTGPNPVFAGVQVLSQGQPNYYAIDGVLNYTANNNLNLYDGFSTFEKFTALSKGLGRVKGGLNAATGCDVVSITGVKIYDVLPGETRKVAFAMSAGNSLSELRNSLAAARNRFAMNNISPQPRVVDVATCSGGSALIAPSNGNRFKFYDRPSLFEPIAEGRFLILNNVRQQQNIYVTSIDSLFESIATPLTVFVNGPRAQFSIPSYINLRASDTLAITNNSTGGLSFKWYLNGLLADTNQNPRIVVRRLGNNLLKLKIGDFDCADSLELNFTAGNIASLKGKLPLGYAVYPNPAKDVVFIESPQGETPQISCLNLQGKLVRLTQTTNSDKSIIDLSNLSRGTYILLIRDKTGTYQVPIIKQ